MLVIVEAGGEGVDLWGFIMSSTFFPVYWKMSTIQSKKKNQANRPEEVFVLFNSNGFIQQTCVFIAHFV